jgi:hypothetical protein
MEPTTPLIGQTLLRDFSFGSLRIRGRAVHAHQQGPGLQRFRPAASGHFGLGVGAESPSRARERPLTALLGEAQQNLLFRVQGARGEVIKIV